MSLTTMKFKINGGRLFISVILLLISIDLYKGGALGPLGVIPPPVTYVQSFIGGTILLTMSIVCLFTSDDKK